jgi:hypothetical protein
MQYNKTRYFLSDVWISPVGAVTNSHKKIHKFVFVAEKVAPNRNAKSALRQK